MGGAIAIGVLIVVILLLALGGSGDPETSVADGPTAPVETTLPPDDMPEEKPLEERLGDLGVIEELAPSDRELALDVERQAGSYGDPDGPLLLSMSKKEVFEALGLPNNYMSYCIPDSINSYSNDRGGYFCRVGDDLYGQMVFREGTPKYNRGAYGLQAWFCCQTKQDILDDAQRAATGETTY